MTLNFDPKVSW